MLSDQDNEALNQELSALLEQLGQAVNLDAVMKILPSVESFLKKVLKSVDFYEKQVTSIEDQKKSGAQTLSLALSFGTDVPAKPETIMQRVMDGSNTPSLLRDLLKGADIQRLYQLKSLLELCELYQDQYGTNGLFYSAFKEYWDNMIKYQPIELTDFRVMTQTESSHPQTVLGKRPTKPGKVYPNLPTSELAQMKLEYFTKDPSADIFLMSNPEKKKIKVIITDKGLTRQGDETGNKPFDNETYNYVVSPKGGFYAAKPEVNEFDKFVHHSTVRSGQPVMSAGEITVGNDANGKTIITSITNYSGHYKPSARQLFGTALWLHSQGLLDPSCMVNIYVGMTPYTKAPIYESLSVDELVHFDYQDKRSIAGKYFKSQTDFELLKQHYLPATQPQLRPITHEPEHRPGNMLLDNPVGIDKAKESEPKRVKLNQEDSEPPSGWRRKN